MSTIQEIKEAAAHLSPREQLEISRWLANSNEVRQLKLEELRRDIQVGIDQADQGRLRDGAEVFERLKQGR